jgi:hypothetical protein
MADVLKFRPRSQPESEQKESWASGDAVCLDCKHEWVAVSSVANEWLECPACLLLRGRFKFPFSIGDKHWTCNCGNDLFRINEKCTYCPNCGEEQKF